MHIFQGQLSQSTYPRREAHQQYMLCTSSSRLNQDSHCLVSLFLYSIRLKNKNWFHTSQDFILEILRGTTKSILKWNYESTRISCLRFRTSVEMWQGKKKKNWNNSGGKTLGDSGGVGVFVEYVKLESFSGICYTWDSRRNQSQKW